MNVRIIAGEFGGRKLTAPSGDRTHPMSERVRGALFNSLAEKVSGADVLDVFAGTGALGLEALSRGAHSAYFVERDRVAWRILTENIDSLGVADRTKLVRANARSWVDTYGGEGFDLIFVDPPYHDPQFSTVELISGLLKPGGTMILSHPGRGEVPIQNMNLFVVDSRSYGNAYLTFFHRKSA